MKRAAVLCLVAALSTSAAAETPGTKTPMPVHVTGRVAQGQDGTMTFGWPGVYFESRFRGDGVEVVVESQTEFMRLLIDGEEKAQFRRPGRASIKLGGLTPGEHMVRLEKQTESQVGGGRFIGFYPTEGAVALAPTPRTRRIEFIGDSYTVGYGDLSSVRSCTSQQVHDLTDSQRAFGPLLARRLDADYRIVAYSGFGIVRNYNGSSPGLSLPTIYDRAVPDDTARQSSTRDDWSPQIIVINLGTNDFSTPLNAGEAWADQAALRSAYRDRYVAFVRMLMTRHPQARFVLLGSDAFYDLVTEVAGRLGDPANIVTARFGGLALDGCDYHPSQADHETLAKLVESAIGRFSDPWPRTRDKVSAQTVR